MQRFFRLRVYSPFFNAISSLKSPQAKKLFLIKIISWYYFNYFMYSITQDMANLPPFRLKSRKPLWKEEFLMEPFSKSDYWKAAWQDVDIFNKNLIEDPTKQLPGFDLPRKIWCKLNRFRTGHGKCNNMLFHWNIRENPSCECGAEKETIQHILEECPLTKFQQGFSKLHLLTEDALNWLQQIKNI
jgi:hypothetical protein